MDSCPYCKRPVDSQGAIFHDGGCDGLKDVRMNRLQYDALIRGVRGDLFGRIGEWLNAYMHDRESYDEATKLLAAVDEYRPRDPHSARANNETT